MCLSCGITAVEVAYSLVVFETVLVLKRMLLFTSALYLEGTTVCSWEVEHGSFSSHTF